MDEDNLYMGLVGLYEKYSTFLPTRGNMSTKNYRYISYRHFTWCVHNKLKKHVRRFDIFCEDEARRKELEYEYNIPLTDQD